jgi:hypothetical protein
MRKPSPGRSGAGVFCFEGGRGTKNEYFPLAFDLLHSAFRVEVVKKLGQAPHGSRFSWEFRKSGSEPVPFSPVLRFPFRNRSNSRIFVTTRKTRKFGIVLHDK